MAACSRKSVRLLFVCSVVVVLLLLGDGAAAQGQGGEQATGVIGSTKGFYLRGNPTVSREDRNKDAEESFESFERREMVEYGSNTVDGSEVKEIMALMVYQEKRVECNL